MLRRLTYTNRREWSGSSLFPAVAMHATVQRRHNSNTDMDLFVVSTLDPIHPHYYYYLSYYHNYHHCASATSFALSMTRPLLYRNILENTLADTPSGYIQDPINHPRTMVQYERLTPEGEAVLEDMAHEKELLEREELAYKGFTTPRTRALKEVIVHVSDDAVSSLGPADAVSGLEEELQYILGLLGQEVAQPLSTEQKLLLKWQQRQAKLKDRANPFRAAAPPEESYRVSVAADGTEKLELRRRHDAFQSNHSNKKEETKEKSDVDGSQYLSQNADDEIFHAALREGKVVTVTINDVNHVRFLLGLAYRRVGQFDKAIDINYDILRDDVHNVEAIESLLEVFTGTSEVVRIRPLLDFLSERFEKERARAPAQSLENLGDAEAPAGSAKVVSDDGGNKSGAPSALQTSTPARIPPVEVALNLLADMVVEAAAKYCAENGEGATTRFFARTLGPIANNIGRVYTGRLIELLFSSIDAQHFLARFEGSMAPEAQSTLLFSLVIAFLKTLLVRDWSHLVRDPLHFEFFTLCKLYTALHYVGRLSESYTVCERLLRLYRSHSSLYARRIAEKSVRKQLAAVGKPIASASSAHESVVSTGASEDDATDINNGAIALAVTSGPLTPFTLQASSSSASDFSPGELDDQDHNYCAAYFDYISDRSLQSTHVGRRLCIEAIEELPRAAIPWHILSLILHREDPKGNLPDAILAARYALELEPTNIKIILTLASFYKADGFIQLHDLMMDRYRLLSYMVESEASKEDILATVQEILEEEAAMAHSRGETTEARHKRLIDEMKDPMKEFQMRMNQSTWYTMPIDETTKNLTSMPVTLPYQQEDAFADWPEGTSPNLKLNE